jgi:hypothetical protein
MGSHVKPGRRPQKPDLSGGHLPKWDSDPSNGLRRLGRHPFHLNPYRLQLVAHRRGARGPAIWSGRVYRSVVCAPQGTGRLPLRAVGEEAESGILSIA